MRTNLLMFWEFKWERTMKGLCPTSDPLTTKREVLQDSSKLFDPQFVPNYLCNNYGNEAEASHGTNHQTRTSWKNGQPHSQISANLLDLKSFTTLFTEPGMELHVFADASTKVYGAVVYICQAKQRAFVIAKGCVAPLKQVTLPRLELMAAVIATRLANLQLPP